MIHTTDMSCEHLLRLWFYDACVNVSFKSNRFPGNFIAQKDAKVSQNTMDIIPTSLR